MSEPVHPAMAKIPSTPRRLLLDHSIPGAKEAGLAIRKDRNLAACRICGSIFQPKYFLMTPDQTYNNIDDPYNLRRIWEAEAEIVEWRREHNKKHSDEEHLQFAMSGMTFTPEAAHKLAPFGLVPVSDVTLERKETAEALYEAPRAPTDDVETTKTGAVSVPDIPKRGA